MWMIPLMMRRSSSSRNVDETHPMDERLDQDSELGGGGRKKKGVGGEGSCLEDSKFKL
jgi:hypothetical protein